MHLFSFTPRTPSSCLPTLAAPHPTMHSAREKKCLFALSTDLYPPSQSPDFSVRQSSPTPELLTASGTSPTFRFCSGRGSAFTCSVENRIRSDSGASSVLKIGEMIAVKCKPMIFGRYRNAKDVLMGVHRSCWTGNSVAVRGIVLHRVGRGRWMVDWDVCSGQRIPICMNEDALKKHLVSENNNINENHGENRVAQPNEL
eukprot:669167-Hanusia_phi.AAC.1